VGSFIFFDGLNSFTPHTRKTKKKKNNVFGGVLFNILALVICFTPLTRETKKKDHLLKSVSRYDNHTFRLRLTKTKKK
jgi:hypothetical protein